jgi:heat shock protein HtpX
MEHRSFQDEIARNKRSSLALAVLVGAVLFFLVYAFTLILAPGYSLVILPFSILLIALYIYSSYIYGDSIVLATAGAQPAEGPEYQYLRDAVEGVSIAAGIPPPKVYVMRSDEINAFSTGRDPEHASVAVTTGAIRELNRAELEGVVAHEISHVRNRDILFMMMLSVLVGLVAVLSYIILRTFWYAGISREERRERGGAIVMIIVAIGFILAIFAPIAVQLIQFAISRRREYLADASGAELTRYPEGLASALEKIMKKNQGKMNISDAVASLFFSDPKRSALESLYDTHPPIEERIKRLRAM